MPTLPNEICLVTDIPAASPAAARAHFEDLLAFETDCRDVHASIEMGAKGFVVLDVRGPEAFSSGHVPGAVNLPHRRITSRALEEYDEELFGVYCAGPHCNGADRAALRIAECGKRVKKMIGGITGWKDEGLPLTVDGRANQ